MQEQRSQLSRTFLSMKNLSENLRHELVILMIGIFWALTCFIALKVLQVDQFLKWQRTMVALLPILPFVFYGIPYCLEPLSMKNRLRILQDEQRWSQAELAERVDGSIHIRRYNHENKICLQISHCGFRSP